MPDGDPQTQSQVDSRGESQSEENVGPSFEYRNRLTDLANQESALAASDRRYVTAKVVVLIAAAVAATWLVKYAPGRLPLLLIALAIFIVVFVMHERVLRRLRINAQRKGFYERGLTRLDGRWPGTGRTGEQFLEASHPYARDIDLFGRGSVFELLCTARTSAGEQRLASWLLAGAPVSEIMLRQQAVTELAPRTDFQERMALAGEDVQTEGKSTPEALTTWAESPGTSVRAGIRVLCFMLAVAWALSVLLWLLGRLDAVPLWHWGALALVLSALNAAMSYAWRKSTAEAAEAAEAAGKELPLLVAVFAAIEQEQFTSQKLTSLQTRLKSVGLSPSRAIAKMNGYREWIVGAHNLMVKAFDPFIFWTRQWIWAAEGWRCRYGKSVREWVGAVAEIEALLALAILKSERPEYVFPEFVVSGLEPAPYLEADDVAHPLVEGRVEGRVVGNSVKLGKAPGHNGGPGLRLIIISGPNMAGKSTFIRSVGVNSVLAQAGAPVRARRMVLSELQVTASICVLDSLQGGLSRFYAEITRLKQICDLTARNLPVLFLLDELLSGTNSHDRRVGAESVVRGLLRHRGIGLVTTHDLALTAIVDTLDGQAANYHFGDTFAEGKLLFDYRLSPGIAESTNALQLMRSIGLTGD